MTELNRFLSVIKNNNSAYGRQTNQLTEDTKQQTKCCN